MAGSHAFSAAAALPIPTTLRSLIGFRKLKGWRNILLFGGCRPN
jgi:hypothetical protein